MKSILERLQGGERFTFSRGFDITYSFSNVRAGDGNDDPHHPLLNEECERGPFCLTDLSEAIKTISSLHNQGKEVRFTVMVKDKVYFYNRHAVDGIWTPVLESSTMTDVLDIAFNIRAIKCTRT